MWYTFQALSNTCCNALRENCTMSGNFMGINLPRRELKTPLQDTWNITERRDGYDFS
jgi:hypothetical protein